MAFARPAGTSRFINRSTAKLGLPSSWLDQEFDALYTAINSMSLISNSTEWFVHPTVPTYVGGTQFTVTGDQTAEFYVNRRVRAELTGSYDYSKVSTSSYSGGTGLTTVTLADSILTASLTEISYGITHSNMSVNAIHAEIIPSTAYGTIAATDVQEAIEEIEDSKVHSDDVIVDHVVSGLLGSDPGAVLAMTTPAGVCYQDGIRIISAGFAYTYTASKDTYDSIDNTGAITHSAVNNGAAAPALPANSQWLQKVVTDGTEITAVTDLRNLIPYKDAVTAPAASKFPYSLANGFLSPAWIARAAQGFDNLTLAVSASSKDLIFSLKTLAGTDPSATDPAMVIFRSATITSGVYVPRTVSAALSLTLSNGSTLGFAAAEVGRIYVWAIDNAGTVELAVSRTSDIFPESALVSTTLEDGAGGSDSASVMYSAAARSNVACRLLGYIEIETGAVAGEWDNAPSKIQLMGPGVLRTGDIASVSSTFTGAQATGTTQIPVDDTIPQKTEGDQYLSQAHVTKHAGARLSVEVQAQMSHNNSAARTLAIALFRGEDAGNDARAAVFGAHFNSDAPVVYKLHHIYTAGAVGTNTFNVRAGANGTGTTSINGSSASRVMGGVANSYIKVTEIVP